MSAANNSALSSPRPLVEPTPCAPPIRDMWWRKSPPMGLTRAIANITVQRLLPTHEGRATRWIETTALGRPLLCQLYPTNHRQGHYFELTEGFCDKLAQLEKSQAAETGNLINVAMMAVWRPQGAGGDHHLHVWIIPAAVVGEMNNRLPSNRAGNRVNGAGRNPTLIPPQNSRPSVWRSRANDPDPLGVQQFYHRWTLSDEELQYVQEAEMQELRPAQGASAAAESFE